MNKTSVSLTIAAIVIGLGAVLFAPAQATSEGNAVTLAAAGEVGYLPAQIVNQATKIEPQPATF